MEPNTQQNPLAGLHKQKMYGLIIAAIGLISVFLPWWKISLGGFGGGYSINGMRDLGILTFLGFVGAGIVTFVMGNKAMPYSGQERLIVAGCFAGAGLFALIQFLRQSSYTSFGLYLAIVAGILGALLVWGIIKTPEK
jgi:peptidoglycan/LPS O-acetylase OafA/YrhL